ncbi:MAG TPA: hypothetical protein VMS65_10725 [Polyangiaceae bacterium]|nr:hypothetical protein [Polyangiaceae bacterium]
MRIGNPDPSVPAAAGRTCAASTGIEWDIGKAVKEGGQVIGVDSPSPTDFGDTLEDGESNANITCTVRKTGSFVSKGGGVDPQITPPGGTINFLMSGVAKKKGTPATNVATASIYTPTTFDMQTNPGFPDCLITTVHEQAPGALWADFDCPALTRTGDPARACRATGTIVLEYCKTGEEND